MIDHHNISTYHPQANGEIESFKKTLTKGLTKFFNLDKNYWDDKLPTILWAYITTHKRSIGQTPQIAQVLNLNLTKDK